MKPALLLLLLLCNACHGSAGRPVPIPGTTASFDLDSDPTQPGFFWDLPWPSDLRINADGKPQMGSFPNPRGIAFIETFRKAASERGGFPVVPVAYFRFDAAIASLDQQFFAADKTSSVLLIDVDASSPERGALTPVVAGTPVHDDYVPRNVLALAPRQGFVLAPKRHYAFVVMRGLNDAAGKPLGVSFALQQLSVGQQPEGALAAQAKAVYAPLWETLATLGLDKAQVAAATVFTTGDVVAETNALSDLVKSKYTITLDGLTQDTVVNDRLCVLKGHMTLPQFQKGTPPFDSDGLFVFDSSGMPVKQRDELSPITIALPRMPMPASGYPLAIYFHGSGGTSYDLIDNGPSLVKDGPMAPGKGPAYVLGAHGLAVASSAMPVNPERLPGAAETAYLNFQNLPAMRDTFRQGVIEQRLYLEALKTLQIDPALIAGCDGPTLPSGATKYFFDAAKLVAQGQSMGGMYTNLVSAVEPRIRAAVPTGAGGFWTYFVLVTQLKGPGLPSLVALLIDAGEPLTFLHPALMLVEMAWEPSDPFVSMPRLARRPLPGHPVRPIYEPVGRGDQYFPTVLYDAVALSYGHQEAGTEVWPTMQPALQLAGLSGLLQYPVKMNRGTYTGVVVQYEGDGIEDPHAIYRQLDAVKYQYGCFFESFLATGTAVVPAPAALGTPCPQ